MRIRPSEALLGIAPLLVGALGSVPTVKAIPGWYRSLDKPSWTPPDRLFGPVWTLLYGLMGLAAVLVVRTTRPTTPIAAIDGPRRRALTLFVGQLGLNLGWSFIFFGAKALRAAAFEIVALWVAILATAVAFARIRLVSGALLVPYLVWTTFAAALNVSIWRRNP